MKYRIEYADKHFCTYAGNRNELLKFLKITEEKITDIRRVLKSGQSESVMDVYKAYVWRH